MTDEPEVPDTWPEWTDKLGQTFRPGDFVAYASVNGRSPQMVFARVLEIRRRDSSGDEITERVQYKTGRKVPRQHDGRMIDEWETRQVPFCKVKVLPIKDARGFSRSKDARPVTLSIPANIIKIGPRPEWTDEHMAADLAELRDSLR